MLEFTTRGDYTVRSAYHSTIESLIDNTEPRVEGN